MVLGLSQSKSGDGRQRRRPDSVSLGGKVNATWITALVFVSGERKRKRWHTGWRAGGDCIVGSVVARQYRSVATQRKSSTDRAQRDCRSLPVLGARRPARK